MTYRPEGLVAIDGQPSSPELLAELREEGNPVLLGFSRGKDSLAAWLSLRDAGVEVVPYFLYHVPGMSFVDESLADFENFFGVRIHRYPHPALFRWLNTFTFQAPQRLAVIDAVDLPEPSYEEMADMIRADLGLPNAWNCDGVRASDSPNRRMAMTTYGPKREATRKLSIVWDWRVAHVREVIAHHGATLPVDYEWFGRSWDGLDLRFVAPLAEHRPEDYALILEWFPMAALEVFRARHAA
ncbi:hypothetical protein [Actinosynnema sp.]|uniref:hypothetical protein n=1 Tax=Actinosynnema sp. TaxID=1872144 RepID=UPI003F84FCE5